MFTLYLNLLVCTKKQLLFWHPENFSKKNFHDFNEVKELRVLLIYKPHAGMSSAQKLEF